MVDKTVKNTVECLEDRIFSTSRFQNNWKQFKSHEKFRILTSEVDYSRIVCLYIQIQIICTISRKVWHDMRVSN